MALTAREWLLLAKEEQEKRKSELSAEESFLLRTELSFIHFTEEEKKTMPKEKKEKFIHPHKATPKEVMAFSEKYNEIFRKMSEEASNIKNTPSILKKGG